MGTMSKVYEVLQDEILKKLDEGVVPWRRTWLGQGKEPRNIVSNKPYSGFNIMWLMCQGRTSEYWMTYKQAKALGGNVKKGEKSTVVTYWSIPKKKEDDGDDKKRFPFIKYYRVFNLDQTEDVEVKWDVEENKDERYQNEPNANCEYIVNNFETMPGIKYGHNPCYWLGKDKIGMPELDKFETAEEYYAALFHEMGHSTMHMNRLNRPKLKYAEEELVAEITACFLCGTAGIKTAVIDNQASYIDGWRKKISANPKLVVQASSMAMKASDYIMNGIVSDIKKQADAHAEKQKKKAA